MTRGLLSAMNSFESCIVWSGECARVVLVGQPPLALKSIETRTAPAAKHWLDVLLDPRFNAGSEQVTNGIRESEGHYRRRADAFWPHCN